MYAALVFAGLIAGLCGLPLAALLIVRWLAVSWLRG